MKTVMVLLLAILFGFGCSKHESSHDPQMPSVELPTHDKVGGSGKSDSGQENSTSSIKKCSISICHHLTTQILEVLLSNMKLRKATGIVASSVGIHQDLLRVMGKEYSILERDLKVIVVEHLLDLESITDLSDFLKKIKNKLAIKGSLP